MFEYFVDFLIGAHVLLLTDLQYIIHSDTRFLHAVRLDLADGKRKAGGSYCLELMLSWTSDLVLRFSMLQCKDTYKIFI